MIREAIEVVLLRMWHRCCQTNSQSQDVPPPTSTKLRLLTQPTSQTCATHNHLKTRTHCVGQGLPSLPGCKEKIGGSVEWWAGMDRLGRRGEPSRRLRLGIRYMLPLMFSLFFLPQTLSREKGRLAQTQTHTQRYFLLGV